MDANTNNGFQILSANNLGGLSTRAQKKRKVHRKTKSGCFTCRAKRVKCDELKPVCVRCMRNTRSCAYDEPGAVLNGTADLSVLSALTVDHLTSPGLKQGISNIHIVRHFQRHWDEIFHMPGIYRIISLSQTKPLIFNAILAISACHLRHISPEVTQYRIAEHSYMSLALKQYRKILNVPRETLGQCDVETLLIGAMLLNILTFPLLDSSVGYEQNTSWVSGSCEDLKGWLALQAGMKPLLMSASAQIQKTRNSLGQTMFGHDERNWPTPNFDLYVDTLPDVWVKAFNLHDPCCIDVFGLPIAILKELQAIKPVRLNVFRNLLFVWKMSVPFRTLLYKKDERAIWLFGYWLGLLCRYEGAWWCNKRVGREYQAICMFLDQLCLPERPGSEGKVWTEMMKEFKLAPIFICT